MTREYICTGRQDSKEALDSFLEKHPEYRDVNAMACIEED